MRLIVTPFVVLLALLSCSTAQALHASIVTIPGWVRRPGPGDLDRYYPERASRLGLSGEAQMICWVTAKGLLANCDSEAETPAGADFGRAAVRMSRLFRFRPATIDGAPQDGAAVRLRLTFTPPLTIGFPGEPEPLHLPGDGRFVFTGFVDEGGVREARYLRLPDTLGGRVRAWVLSVRLPAGDPLSKPAYAASYRLFDCPAGRQDAPPFEVFDRWGGINGYRSGGRDLQAPTAGSDAVAMILACGRGPPADADEGLKAAIAGGQARLRAARR